MLNDTIKQLLDRVGNGGQLTPDEQVAVLRGLLRANHRLRAAKAAGFADVVVIAAAAEPARPQRRRIRAALRDFEMPE